MGYSDSSSSIGGGGGGVWCKKHPRHKQSPGVCSCCLREKLSFHLNSSSSFSSSIHSFSSVLSSSPSYSPSPPQTSSPPPIHQQIQTTTINKDPGPGPGAGPGPDAVPGPDDDQISSTSTAASGNLDEYKRSHSIGGGIIGEGISVRKKKGGAGFLLKYLKPTTRKCSKMVCMMQHSKTMNETTTKRFY